MQGFPRRLTGKFDAYVLTKDKNGRSVCFPIPWSNVASSRTTAVVMTRREVSREINAKKSGAKPGLTG